MRCIPRIRVSQRLVRSWPLTSTVLPDLYDALVPVGKDSFYLDIDMRQSGAVLELACGIGLLTVPIEAMGLQTVGLDLSGPMLVAVNDAQSPQELRWNGCK